MQTNRQMNARLFCGVVSSIDEVINLQQSRTLEPTCTDCNVGSRRRKKGHFQKYILCDNHSNDKIPIQSNDELPIQSNDEIPFQRHDEIPNVDSGYWLMVEHELTACDMAADAGLD